MFRLNGIPIYPQEYPRPNTNTPVQYSDVWYIMPGRKLIHIDKLHVLAQKLNTKLELTEF